MEADEFWTDTWEERKEKLEERRIKKNKKRTQSDHESETTLSKEAPNKDDAIKTKRQKSAKRTPIDTPSTITNLTAKKSNDVVSNYKNVSHIFPNSSRKTLRVVTSDDRFYHFSSCFSDPSSLVTTSSKGIVQLWNIEDK